MSPMRHRCATLLLALTLTGCATRYGHVMDQSLVKIETEPEGLSYYVLDKTQAREILGSEAIDVPRAKARRLEQFLGSQLRLSADGSEFSYEKGAYVVVVTCPNVYRAKVLNVSREESTSLKINCP